MTSRLEIIDSGAAARRVRRLFVIDGGGVARKVKKLWTIDGGGAARLVYRSGAEIIVTGAHYNNGTYDYYGRDGSGQSGTTFGSISPGTYVDAAGNTRTINDMFDNTDGAFVFQCRFQLVGASIPNTDDTFVSLTLGGTTLLRSAATYSPSVGVGNSQWLWNSMLGHGVATYPVTIDLA